MQWPRGRVATGILGIAALLALGLVIQKWRAAPLPIRIAFASSITGSSASAGAESLAAVNLYIESVNRKGGINGRPVELVLFDDASSADVARANVEAIADSACIAVLGHYLSTSSLAAAPGYKAARIPAVTGTSFVDELTTDNPYYFRAQTTSSLQGRSIAEYLRTVMKSPVVHLVYSRDSFGFSFLKGFVQGYAGKQFENWGFEVGAAIRAQSVRTTIDELAKQPEPGIIVIGTGADYIADVLKAIRRQAIWVPVIAAGGAGSEEFLNNFAAEQEEQQEPGFFAKHLYATAPVIFDSAGAAAQVFAAAYVKASGKRPGWIAAGTDNAARVLIEAIRRAQIENSAASRQADRERVRAELAKMDRRETAVAGIGGPLYFDSNHDMPRPVRLGYFHLGRFVTAPTQLVLIDRPESIDLESEIRNARAVKMSGRPYWIQRVVYTGIDVNRLNRIDTRQGTFNIDFYLWMRYAGEDDAPTRVEFPDLLDREIFDPTRPREAGVEDGLNYRLYRMSGNFKANYDLHDYPFDVQRLVLRLQNVQQRRELVTYVIDVFGLRLAGEKTSVANAENAYSGVQLWRFQALRYFVDSLSSASTFGKPSLFATDNTTEFAGFNAVIVLDRDYALFVFKTLLPLLLLAIVVFATLFFPATLYRERTTIPVTAILTSAVLLIAVNSQIGDIGYTVAIETVFYVFFALCLAAMLTAFLHEQLRQRSRARLATTIDRSMQIVYTGTVLATLAVFYLRYGTAVN
jgi:ABC-type branched-subunit amino acid transport system substrate-binding protein